MPIRPEMRERYPKDWALRSRFVRFYRARNRCEWCGVPQYAAGRWANGSFELIRGSLYLDALAYSGSYREARAVADHHNQCRTPGEQQYIVIVLTVAHVYDHRPEAASLLNLAALCQRCHNRHDAAHRRAGINARKPQLTLELTHA